MKRQAIVLFYLLTAVVTANFRPGLAQELRGPIPQTSGTTALPDKELGYQAGEQARTGMAGLSTSGGDAEMNQDMLLVNPSSGTGTTGGVAASGAPAKPLTAGTSLSQSIGTSITMTVDPGVVIYKNLRGLTVTVVNDTGKPLIIDGDKAVAIQGSKQYKSAQNTDVELAISPVPTLKTAFHDFTTIVLPDAASAGLVPVIKDLKTYSKPTLARYGKDQQRREIEGSRFGRRILWPHEKTQGVIYFQTIDLDFSAKAKVELPVSTMFDNKDLGVLSSKP